MITNWRAELICELKHYEERCIALQTLQNEIDELDSILTGINSGLNDSTPVIGGTNSKDDKYLNIMWQRDSRNAWKKFVELNVRLLSESLAKLSKDDYEIIYQSFIKRTNYYTICQNLHIEKSEFYRRRDAALDRLGRIRFGN